MAEPLDFTDFDRRPTHPTEGSVRFVVDQSRLKEVVSIVKTTTAGGTQFGAVEVTVFNDRLRLRTFNQIAFTEATVPLAERAFEGDDALGFVFEHARLEKLASSFPAGDITMEMVFPSRMLRVQSGRTELELAALPPEDFLDYHARMGKRTARGPVSPEVLRAALRHVGLFTRPDASNEALSIVEIRDGALYGGINSSIASFSAPAAFDGLDMRVRTSGVKVLEKLLPSLDAGTAELFETDTFSVLRDASTFVGFERTEARFPATDRFFARDPEDQLTLPREELTQALDRLSVVNSAQTGYVHILSQGKGDTVVTTLSTSDATGKMSRDTVSGTRATEEDEPADWSVYLSFPTFQKIVNHFETPTVRLGTIANMILLVMDEGSLADSAQTNWTARTALGLLTPAQARGGN
jgi:DNA polymerase III sliding clamp (beta) subunit (PCNA family)